MSLFNKNIANETIIVEGIKCQHCVKRITETLKKHNVKTIISLEEKLVKVSFNNKKISLEQIKTIIDELGFQCI